jgi:hypothetical protein
MIKTIDFPFGYIKVDLSEKTYDHKGHEATDFIHTNHEVYAEHTIYLSLVTYLLDIGEIKQCTICDEYFDGKEAGEYCSEDCERKAEFSDMEDQSNGVTEKY